MNRHGANWLSLVEDGRLDQATAIETALSHDLCADMFSGKPVLVSRRIPSVKHCQSRYFLLGFLVLGMVTKMGANRCSPKRSEPMESANQRDAMVVGCTSAYYRSATLVSASIISLQRTICLDKYWFCVGPCNGTLCRLRGP